MIVRKCNPGDKEIWMKLNQRHMDEELGVTSYWSETKEKGYSRLAESFEAALEKEHSILLLVFEVEGEVVGFANLNIVYNVWSKGEALVVDDFYISADSRNKGYGKEALVMIEKYAQDEGFKRIQFNSFLEDEHIIKVWEEFGYHPMDAKFYMRYV